MFYVASVRRKGDLCADAKIFSSREEAVAFVDGKDVDADYYVHINVYESEHEARNEYEYQTQTSFGR